MAFIKEIPAFDPPNASIKPVYDRIQEGGTVNSIPSDSGLLHSGTPRKHLTFREALNNSVIQHYGSYIVMGTDRMGHLGQGAGASGYSNADAVDIVVGRAANLPPQKPLSGLGDLGADDTKVPGPPDGFITGPLPTSDAARIYISSKTNLDKSFGLASGKRDPHDGSNKHLLSGIALKADNVRMIGRNNIKIVTGRNIGFTGGKEKNSLGGTSPQAGTISLIGGNYTDKDLKWAGLFSPNGAVQQSPYLQPAIKGENLVECLHALFEYVDQTNALFYNLCMISMSSEAAEVASPLSDPITKASKILALGLKHPFGVEQTFELRAWALTQKRKYLEFGGDWHIRSSNVYLT